MRFNLFVRPQRFQIETFVWFSLSSTPQFGLLASFERCLPSFCGSPGSLFTDPLVRGSRVSSPVTRSVLDPLFRSPVLTPQERAFSPGLVTRVCRLLRKFLPPLFRVLIIHDHDDVLFAIRLPHYSLCGLSVGFGSDRLHPSGPGSCLDFYPSVYGVSFSTISLSPFFLTDVI